MIKTIIFDIGNVLAEFRWQQYISNFNYPKETADKLAAATVLHPVWNEFDRGLKTDEEIKKICIEYAPDCEEQIKRFFDEISDIVEEYDYSADWILDLKNRGYQVYVLSNYPETTYSYAKEKFEFLKYIDGGIISYEIKKIKPEPEIYQALIDKYSIIPKESVFLDDKLENLEPAKNLGFHTIHVKPISDSMMTLNNLLVSLDDLLDKYRI